MEIRNSYTHDLIGVVPSASVDDVRKAIADAEAALKTDFPLLSRCDVLMRAAALVEARKEEYSRIIALVGSKAIKETPREPVRTAQILRFAAEEARRLTGQTLPFESRAGSENRGSPKPAARC